MTIGEKLKMARNDKAMTQEQVAEEIMVSRQTISNWENGKSLPDIISVIKISDLYSISLDELLKGDQKMAKKIEVDMDVVKSNKRLIFIGVSVALLASVLKVMDLFMTSPILDFTTAAMPWVLVGVGVACAMTYYKHKESQ